ncbi:MAG: hypothetical protein AABX13_02640 [Nanoarchaeota archaeon]
MHKMLQTLEERLQGLGRKEQRHLLSNIYDQLVPGKKSGQQKPGEYRDFAQGGGENLLEFVLHFEQKLKAYQLDTRAARLHHHYLGERYVSKE